MAYRVTFDKGESYTSIAYDSIPLKALYSILVPALCMGRIPHGAILCVVEPDLIQPDHVQLVREIGTLQSLNLLVDQGPVRVGEVFTHVFNLSGLPVVVKKGTVLSRLILVRGVRWGY